MKPNGSMFADWVRTTAAVTACVCVLTAGLGARCAAFASFNRIETIVKNKHARLIVQHDPQEFDALPKLPAYLD